MDFQALNQQVNDTVNAWIAAAQEYFTHLSQLEIYGWAGLGLGFVLLVVGFILL